MQNLEFSNQDKWRIRKFTGHLFEGKRIYAGDIIEYRKGNYKELGEVQKKHIGYLVGAKPFEGLEIIRVINMGGAGAGGRYVQGIEK
jgi:hypothetical protein